MIAAIMTWCAGETDADRFVLSRSFYVQIHCPKRQRPGKAFSGFCKAMLRLPMPVWWAFCDAVRSRVFHLLADRMTMEGWLPLGCDGSRMECPRTAELEQSLGKSSKDKSAPTLWVIALVSLTTGVLWSWHLGTSKTGERRYLIDLLETLPQAVLQSVLLVCDAGYVGYDLFGLLLKQQCSFLIRLSSQAQLYSLEMVKVEGFTEGEFWYWTDDAENKSKPALRVRVIRVAAGSARTTFGWSPTFWTPAIAGGIGGSILPDEVGNECFFRTYKRVVKDVRLVSRTVPMVVRKAEISLLACQLLLGQGALALKVGGKRAGRDELKCSAAEVLREIRRELDAARKPVPRSSFAKRLQQTGRDRRERTGPKMKREPPRRKKHVAPQPPRLKVLSAEQKRRSRIQTSRKRRPKLLCEHEILEESMESVIGVEGHPLSGHRETLLAPNVIGALDVGRWGVTTRSANLAGDDSWVAGTELATASEPPARRPRIWGRCPSGVDPSHP